MVAVHKTDKRDARELCNRLDRYVRGNTDAFAVVRVPTPEQEQIRALTRQRGAVLKERQRCVVRGHGLMQTIARVIDVRYEDLYGLAGYDTPERLPTFAPYLRAKYELPPQAIGELERYFEMLRNFYDIPPDQPVFPPKPKGTDKPGPAKTEETPDRRVT